MNKKAMVWATVLAAANLLSTFHEMHNPTPAPAPAPKVPNLPHTPSSNWKFLAWLVGIEVVAAVCVVGVLWLSR